MIAAYLLIYVPVLLFVVAFLYETYLSVARLKNGKYGRKGYVDATWEVTHTILVFAVVMLLMLFTKHIDTIATAIFLPTFIAMTALMVRGACYVHIFYIRSQPAARTWVDWLFMLSHVVAALSLVVSVIAFTWVLIFDHPEANLQFIPSFLVGLAIVGAAVAGPLLYLYTLNDKKK